MRISHLAQEFGLTRGTLLHYDRLHLLEPTGRNGSNYREYSAQDKARLERICLLRKAGVSLKEIARILDGEGDDLLTPVLEHRLAELDQEMEDLRSQQRLIAALLKRNPEPASPQPLRWEDWVSLIKAAGLTLGDLKAWHGRFERFSPDKHRRFLERLRVPNGERARLKSWGVILPELQISQHVA